MIVHTHEQGSPEWTQSRLCVVTASRASDLITPKTLKRSASMKPYVHEKVGETLLGAPLDETRGGWLDRGNEIEREARNWYAFRNLSADVTEVGFITTDDGRIGASLDALVDDDGSAEIKCPSLKVHIGNLLDPDAFVVKHRLQVQFQLMVSEREWCDLVSYCPGQPAVCVRIHRDAEIIDKLRDAARECVKQIDLALARIREMQPQLSDDPIERGAQLIFGD